MIGYYPAPREGELLYSTTSIALRSACNGGNAVDRNRIIGGRCRSFGVALPGYARALQAHVPRFVGLSDQLVIDSSAYYAIAPFLGALTATQLKEEMFSEAPKPRNRLLGRQEKISLKYCLLCAREDHEKGDRPMWAIAANIPGTTCCARHECYLTDTGLLPGDRNLLYSAPECVRLKGQIPERASSWEIEVARDLQFIIAQKGRLMPGRRTVGLALGVEFYKIARFVSRNGRLQLDVISADLRDKMNDVVASLDPEMFNGALVTGVLHGSYPVQFQRASLLAQLVGMNLRDLLQRIHSLEGEINVLAQRIRRRSKLWYGHTGLDLAGLKRHVLTLIQSRPDVRIGTEGIKLPRELKRLQTADPHWYRQNRSAIEAWLRRYWRAADTLACRRITELASHSSLGKCTAFGFTRGSVLKLAELPMTLLQMSRGNLSRTEALVQQLIAIRNERQLEQSRYVVKCAMALDPDANRNELLRWCSSDLKRLAEKDPLWLDENLPRPRGRFRYWRRKDIEVMAILRRINAAAIPLGRIPSTVHKFAMIAGLRWNTYESLLKGRLPQSERLIDQMIAEHNAAWVRSS